MSNKFKLIKYYRYFLLKALLSIVYVSILSSCHSLNTISSMSLAAQYSNMHQYDKAVKHSTIAINKLNNLTEEEINIYGIYEIRGISNYCLNNYSEALSDLLIARKILIDLTEDDILWSMGTLTDEEIIADYNSWIGLSYYHLDEFDQANSYMLLSFKYYNEDYLTNMMLGCINLNMELTNSANKYFNYLTELYPEKKTMYNIDKCNEVIRKHDNEICF